MTTIRYLLRSTRLVICGAGLGVFCQLGMAQDQTVSGNLTVSGTTDLKGNLFTFGSQNASPGLSLTYADADVDTLTFYLNRNPASWLWAHTASIAAMRLTANHELFLYNADGSTVGLAFTPATSTISLGGTTLFRDSSGALRTNSALTVDGAFTAASIGSTSGLALSAGGTDQNVTLTPSGVGAVAINGNASIQNNLSVGGNVGVGTATVPSVLTVGAFSAGTNNGMTQMFTNPNQGSYMTAAGFPWRAQAIIQGVASYSIHGNNRASLIVSQQVAQGVSPDPTPVGTFTDVYDPATFAGNIGTMKGSQVSVSHYGSGTAGVWGQWVLANNYSSANAVVGVRSIASSGTAVGSSSSPTASSLIAFAAGWSNGASSTVGTATGLNVGSLTNAGTITNTYGIFIDTLTSGTQTNKPYSIYASDTNASSYFAGSVGIGTSTPAAALDVTGSANLTGNLAVGGSVTVTTAARFDGPVRIAPQGDLSMGSFTSEP